MTPEASKERATDERFTALAKRLRDRAAEGGFGYVLCEEAADALDSLRERATDCPCFQAAFLRVMAEGSALLSDRDDTERLWPETRKMLREIADTIDADRAELQFLRERIAASAVVRLEGIEHRAEAMLEQFAARADAEVEASYATAFFIVHNEIYHSHKDGETNG